MASHVEGPWNRRDEMKMQAMLACGAIFNALILYQCWGSRFDGLSIASIAVCVTSMAYNIVLYDIGRAGRRVINSNAELLALLDQIMMDKGAAKGGNTPDAPSIFFH